MLLDVKQYLEEIPTIKWNYIELNTSLKRDKNKEKLKLTEYKISDEIRIRN